MAKKVDCSELAKTINDIAMTLGADQRFDTIDKITAEMQRHMPEITKQEVVNSIVEVSASRAREISDTQKQLAKLRREAKKIHEPTAKERVEKQIVELERRLEEGDIAPHKRVSEPPESKELKALLYERDRLRGVINSRIRALKPATIWQHLAEPVNTSRAIITSIDLSALARQGSFILFSDPATSARNLGTMFRAFASARQSHELMRKLWERPNSHLYRRYKLGITALDVSEGLSAQEEAYQGRVADKIPFVAGSGRAYTVFLNHLRADAFDTFAATLARNGELTETEGQDLASGINILTGRGSLGQKFEAAAPLLSQIFFSPRYVASTIQQLIGQPIWASRGRARTLFIKQYAKFLIGTALFYALMRLVLDDDAFEWDMRSADFGKIKIGNTRLDPLAGRQQYLVLGAKIATGKKVSTRTGEEIDLRGEGKKYGEGLDREIYRFGRQKLSPGVGIPIDIITGEDVRGRKVTPETVIVGLFPMNPVNVAEAIEAEGVPKGTALGIASTFGFGIQTHEDDKDKKDKP